MEPQQKEGQDGLPGVPSHVCTCPGLCPAAFVSARGRCPRSRLELIHQPSQPEGAAAGTTPFPWESHALLGTSGPSSYAGSCVPPTSRQQRQGGLSQREAAAPQASESHGLGSGTGREKRLLQACRGGGGRRWGCGSEPLCCAAPCARWALTCDLPLKGADPLATVSQTGAGGCALEGWARQPWGALGNPESVTHSPHQRLELPAELCGHLCLTLPDPTTARKVSRHSDPVRASLREAPSEPLLPLGCDVGPFCPARDPSGLASAASGTA